MLTIHLHKLLFYSFHGIYKEEQVLGNEFEVSADIEVDNQEQKITTIRQTSRAGMRRPAINIDGVLAGIDIEIDTGTAAVGAEDRSGDRFGSKAGARGE